MNIQIFDNLLKNIPKQECGLYIIENQSWEYCFIKLWKNTSMEDYQLTLILPCAFGRKIFKKKTRINIKE